MNLLTDHDLDVEQEQSWQSAVSDIAFLLIIFFILTASFSVTRVLQLSIEDRINGNQTGRKYIHLELIDNNSCLVDGKAISLSIINNILTTEESYIITINDSVNYQSVVTLLDKFSEKKIYSLQLKL